jgi:hypothetical protein
MFECFMSALLVDLRCFREWSMDARRKALIYVIVWFKGQRRRLKIDRNCQLPDHDSNFCRDRREFWEYCER